MDYDFEYGLLQGLLENHTDLTETQINIISLAVANADISKKQKCNILNYITVELAYQHLRQVIKTTTMKTNLTNLTMNPYQEEIDTMLPNIGKQGYLTDAIGSLEDHQDYNGEILTITSVTPDAFYVVSLNDARKSWVADTNEFKILKQ